MKSDCEACRYEMVYRIQFENLTCAMNEIKERVQRLESILVRGVLLLVANLVGMVVTLAHQFFN